MSKDRSNNRNQKVRWNGVILPKKRNEKLEGLALLAIAVIVAGVLLVVLEIMAATFKTGLATWTTRNSQTVNYVRIYISNLKFPHVLLQGMATAIAWLYGGASDVYDKMKSRLVNLPNGVKGLIFILATAAAFELVNIVAFLGEFCISAVCAGVTSIMPTVEVTNIIRLSLLAEQFDPIVRLMEGFILLSVRGFCKLSRMQ